MDYKTIVIPNDITVQIGVKVLNKRTKDVLIKYQFYKCKVQPLPHFFHRRQVLEIQVFALAKIKFINDLYTRITKEDLIFDLLEGVEWTIDAELLTWQ